MAGHSKWANIKHKKAKADAKKGKAFSKATKEIINAVKQGGPDPDANPKLRVAIDKAKAVNLPNDNIERNIKKASSTDTGGYDEITYELYGHEGVGIIVEAMTDNKNRTASDLRIATNKRGGSLAQPGAVSFNFNRVGILSIPKDAVSEEKLFLAATDAGAEDIETHDEGHIVTTPPDELYKVKATLEEMGIPCEDVSLEMVPNVLAPCSKEATEKNTALIEWLEDIDDVDEVYHNMDPQE